MDPTLTAVQAYRRRSQEWVNGLKKNTDGLNYDDLRIYLETIRIFDADGAFFELIAMFPYHIDIFVRKITKPSATSCDWVVKDTLSELVFDFCANPMLRSKKRNMILIYKFIDVRILDKLVKLLPEINFQNFGSSYYTRATIPFRDYDEQWSVYCHEATNMRLIGDALLLQISIGKQKSMEWDGFAKRAKNFHRTTNSDVSGVFARIMQFVVPKKPCMPVGYYPFELYDGSLKPLKERFGQGYVYALKEERQLWDKYKNKLTKMDLKYKLR